MIPEADPKENQQNGSDLSETDLAPSIKVLPILEMNENITSPSQDKSRLNDNQKTTDKHLQNEKSESRLAEEMRMDNDNENGLIKNEDNVKQETDCTTTQIKSEPGTKKKKDKCPKSNMKEIPHLIANGRYFCMTGQCRVDGKSYQWGKGLRQHFRQHHQLQGRFYVFRPNKGN